MLKKIYSCILIFLGSFLILSNLYATDVIAHRSASGYLPEHTTEGVAYAHALGVNFIEQDVVLTSDNVPIILHDIYLDTTTNVATVFPNRMRKDGRFYALDFTLAEIKTLSVHERVDEKTKNAVFANRYPVNSKNNAHNDSFKVPTLEEEINLIQNLNHSTSKNVGLYVELKMPNWHKLQGKDISLITLEVLKRYGYETKQDNFFLQIFDYSEVKRVRDELNYQGKLIQLLANEQELADNTDYKYLMSKAGMVELAQYVDGVGPSITQLMTDDPNIPSDFVSFAKDNKLLIHPYTVRIDELPEGFTKEQLYNFLFNVAQVDGTFSDFADDTLNFVNQTTK